MPVDDAYADQRLASLYDAFNPGRDDIEYYLRLAERLGATNVVDIGCGTGVLAVELAADGRTVYGVDPAVEMLRIARNRPGGDRVTWIEADATELPERAFDLAVMTGHVAQVFLDDEEWDTVLVEIHRALRQGGTLAFESRDPRARAWREWTADRPRSTVEVDGEQVTEWNEVTDVRGDLVEFTSHAQFAVSGEDLMSTSTLRFPTEEHLVDSVTMAGFTVTGVAGDWQGGPVTERTRELIVTATAD